MKQKIEQSKIEIGSYVKIVNGTLLNKIYKVFGISNEGSFISIGVKHAIESVNISDVVAASEEDFNDANQDELSEDGFFF